MAYRNHFLAEFLEVGGALTVLEVVGLREGREHAKAEGLQLLSVIAGHGRQFKELLCESFGEQTAPFFSLTLLTHSPSLTLSAVKVVTECLAHSLSEETQELAQNLLHKLFTVSSPTNYICLQNNVSSNLYRDLLCHCMP